MPYDPMNTCSGEALAAGHKIRGLINGMPLAEREAQVASILKPVARSRYVDAAAEKVGIEHLQRIATVTGYRVNLIVDPATNAVQRIGTSDEARSIWAYFDAVDGTIKVAGLGNQPGRFRCANDGNWGTAFAFTQPTDKYLDELCIGDFKTAVIVDGNPTKHKAYPNNIVATLTGTPIAYDRSERARQVFTSTNTDLSHAIVYFDAFQAYDRNTAGKQDEKLAVELYRRLINRNEGGAFDVWRSYGNLAALPKMMLGWRDTTPWLESQGVGFITINENLPNMIPAVPVVLAAGGVAFDFQGSLLAKRKLMAGKANTIYAANEVVAQRLLAIVSEAKAAVLQG